MPALPRYRNAGCSKLPTRRAEQRYSERYRQKATEAYLRAIEKNRFDILVHPGLHWPLEYQKIAEACQAYGVAMEISARPKHLIF